MRTFSRSQKESIRNDLISGGDKDILFDANERSRLQVIDLLKKIEQGNYFGGPNSVYEFLLEELADFKQNEGDGLLDDWEVAENRKLAELIRVIEATERQTP